jgi:hypothetical protein
VPRTADRAPSRTFYTFRCNIGSALGRLAADLYRAAGNLHARLAHELDKHRWGCPCRVFLVLMLWASLSVRRADKVCAVLLGTARSLEVTWVL